MSASRDSTESPPDPDLETLDDNSPPSASSRKELNRLARRVLPGSVVHLKLQDGSSRRLTVEKTGVPEWTSQCIADTKETGKVLSGYGTTYFLVGHITNADTYTPTLTWPSKSPMGSYVTEITVEEPADEQIRAEKTSADLFWRVERYCGR